MRALMSRIASVCLVLVLAACGKEIGDECVSNLDCGDGTNPARICDLESPGGYCTEMGCDWDTCAEEAVCVRFFTASFENKPCDAAQEDLTIDQCAIDEACTLSGQCVPRSSEVRYCMRRCSDGGDCRSNYECRDEALMRAHGGEPVPKPGERTGTNLTKFCAAAPI